MRAPIHLLLALPCLVSGASSAGASTFQPELPVATGPVIAAEADPGLITAIPGAGLADVAAQADASARQGYSILLSSELAIDPRSDALSRSVIDELVRADVR